MNICFKLFNIFTENDDARDSTAEEIADFLELPVSKRAEPKYTEIASETDPQMPSNEVGALVIGALIFLLFDYYSRGKLKCFPCHNLRGILLNSCSTCLAKNCMGSTYEVS